MAETETEREAGYDLEPLGDRIIVRVIKEDEVSAGGVVLPEQSREASQEGRVLSAGPGRWEHGERVPMGVGPGDVVLFSQYGGTELPRRRDDGLLVLREADVLAKRKLDVLAATCPECGVNLAARDGEGNRIAVCHAEGCRAVEQAVAAAGRFGPPESRTPKGMFPMPKSGVATPYELITEAYARARGWLDAGRRQEVRNGYRYDFDAQSYWPEPGAEPVPVESEERGPGERERTG